MIYVHTERKCLHVYMRVSQMDTNTHALHHPIRVLFVLSVAHAQLAPAQHNRAPNRHHKRFGDTGENGLTWGKRVQT